MTLQLLEYFPQNPSSPKYSTWFPENASETTKIKDLQKLLGVPVTGDFDTKTANKIRLKWPFSYAVASHRLMLDNIDHILSQLLTAKADKGDDTKDPDTKDPEAGADESWVSKNKYYLAAGGVGLLAVGMIIKRRGMLQGFGAYRKMSPREKRQREMMFAREQAGRPYASEWDKIAQDTEGRRKYAKQVLRRAGIKATTKNVDLFLRGT